MIYYIRLENKKMEVLNTSYDGFKVNIFPQIGKTYVVQNPVLYFYVVRTDISSLSSIDVYYQRFSVLIIGKQSHISDNGNFTSILCKKIKILKLLL